jgi:DNA gyrase subunit A
VITIKTTPRNGMVAGAMQVASDDHLMLSTEGGKIIRMVIADISTVGRNTQGVRLVELTDDLVSGVMRLAEPEDDEEEEE